MKKGNKTLIFIICLIVFFLVIFLVFYPHIEIDKGDRLIVCSYSDDFSEFDNNLTYNENYAYNEERDISVYSYDVKQFFFFYTITMEYVEGDMRAVEFLLEEEYIHNFLENAEITYNTGDIDIAKLIEGKEAIVGNTRYTGNTYDQFIEYKLDGRYEIMYVFYVEDLLVLQVGYSDEGPKFIAYKQGIVFKIADSSKKEQRR